MTNGPYKGLGGKGRGYHSEHETILQVDKMPMNTIIHSYNFSVINRAETTIRI